MDVLLLNLVFIERKRVRRGNELPRPDFQLFAPLIPVHAPDVYSEYIDNLKFSLGKWMEPALVWEKSTIYTFILTEKLASKVFFKVFLTDSLPQLIWPFFGSCMYLLNKELGEHVSHLLGLVMAVPHAGAPRAPVHPLKLDYWRFSLPFSLSNNLSRVILDNFKLKEGIKLYLQVFLIPHLA